jgi:drug/metabolite transporter (DMT)-like permease
MPNERAALIYALCAVLLWSTVATAFKIALQYNSALVLVAGASLTSLLTLTVILVLQGKLVQALRSFTSNLKITALLGMINPVIYYLILFEAYDRLPAQVAQPINYTWAIMLALLSVPLLGHRLTRFDLVGLLLGYSGVTLISLAGKNISGTLDLFGLALALISTLLWALFWIINTRQKQDPTISLFHNFLFATPVLILLLALWPGASIQLTVPSLLSTLYVGLFEMGITFFLWQQALHHTEKTARIGALIFLSPIISLMLISLVLKEPLQWLTFSGLGFIIAGVWLSQHKSSASVK